MEYRRKRNVDLDFISKYKSIIGVTRKRRLQQMRHIRRSRNRLMKEVIDQNPEVENDRWEDSK